VLPASAAWHHLRGRVRARALRRDQPHRRAPPRRPAAVLLDRDGTLVVDVPYNADPERVVAVDGARRALDRLRASGVLLAVVTNQSGIGRGVLSAEDVAAVNERVEQLLGPLGPWLVCPHDPEAGCACRKPRPGLVLEAAVALGVAPDRCAVVGDIASDLQAAAAAGARGVLVPNERTRPRRSSRRPRSRPISARRSTCCWERHDPCSRRPSGQRRRRAAGRSRRARRGRGRAARDAAVRPAGAEAARLLPGVDEVVVQGAEWIAAHPQPVRRDDVERRIDELAALRRGPRADPHVVSPEPAAHGAAAADGRRGRDRRDLRGLPRDAARRPPPTCPTTSTRHAAACRWRAPWVRAARR
jgi:histidinol-phosphate phosphatase family protein